MSGESPASAFWGAVRSWADEAGLLLPQDEESTPPKVPPAVCESCPICQGAATLDQVNPDLFTDLADLARNIVSGLASAMASASDQRDTARAHRQDVAPEVAVTDREQEHPGADLGDRYPSDDPEGGYPADELVDEDAQDEPDEDIPADDSDGDGRAR